MKKAVLVIAFMVASGIAGWFVFQTISAKTGGSEEDITNVSPETAAGLQAKINRLKKHAKAPESTPTEPITVYEAELESYVLYVLREDIPVQIDSFDVQLAPE